MTTSKLQHVLERGYLIVGTGNTNVPWHYKDDNNELAGFDVEMGRILAKSLFDDPSKVVFLEQDPDARIENVLSDKVDIVFQGMSISAYRMQQVTFSVPYYTEGVGLIMNAKGKHKNHAALVAAQKAGEKVTIAVVQNPDAHEAVEEMVEGATDLQVKDAGEIYQAVDAGNADAGMADLSSIIWLVNKHAEKYVDSGFQPTRRTTAVRCIPSSRCGSTT